jgi:hypothetical protein
MFITVTMMAVILVIDTHANAWLESYREQLAQAREPISPLM